MEPIRIAGLELPGPVVLGPMAGVTSLAYREFMKPFGVDLSFSEMISDCGLVYGNEKTRRYFRTSFRDRPVGLQLFGSELRVTVQAIAILERDADYDVLDLNFGCPVPKVTKTGAGSAWLQRPYELYAYVRQIVAASAKPVTAKIRLGWDDAHKNAWEVAKALEASGVSMLTIHARTTAQGYAGKADHEFLKNIGESLSIPLCISGDIFTPTDAMRAMSITKAKLVMVARGGLGNPELVTNIHRVWEGQAPLPPPALAADAAYARDFAYRLKEEIGERQASLLLRGLLPHFFTGFPGYKKIRVALAQSGAGYEEIERFLAALEKGSEI